MKQKTKGILAFAFLGGILLTSTVLFALPPPDPTMSEEEAAQFFDIVGATAVSYKHLTLPTIYSV